MAKQATLTSITSTNNNASTLNTNFSALNTALNNTLSLDGSTPNQMSADIDLNSNDLLNVATLNAAQFYLAGVLVANLAAFPTYEGTWLTATAYLAYDIVYVAPNKIYRATEDHTSGVFATDLTAERWELFDDKAIDQALVVITGGTIAGITDLAVADGGTGASTAGDARTNLGLVIGTDVQAFSELLKDISTDITFAAGDVVYATGAAALVKLGIGTVGQVLTTNSGATAPEWATVSANTQSFVIAVSDETTALTTGAAKVTFRMPYAFTLTAVRASVTTAPTDATILVDINETATTILSTKLMIDATEKTSQTAATAAVISDASLADDAEITIDIDQVGSTIAGAGLKITLVGVKA